MTIVVSYPMDQSLQEQKIQMRHSCAPLDLDVVNDRIKHCLCHVAGDQMSVQLVLVQASACFINLEVAEHIVEIFFSRRLLQCEILWKHLAIGYIWLMQLL
nr:hypothetical protein CFP56_15545 [Quercus suber]